MISIPFPPVFNIIGKMQMLLFNFHSFFDGLIGMDLLAQLGATIDLPNLLLKTNKTTIPILTYCNRTSDIHNIPAHTKLIVPLPVKPGNEEFLCNTIEINKDLQISGGLYRAINNVTNFEVVNYSDSDQLLYLETPIEGNPHRESDHIELFNLTSDLYKPQPQPTCLKELQTNHLNPEEKHALTKICTKFSHVFYNDNETLSFTNKIRHSIPTTSETPIHARSYRYPFIHKDEVKKQIDLMLNQDIIRSSFSPWSAPVWVVPKKTPQNGQQKWRLVIDYRKLNDITVSDRYPIPNINDILDRIGKAKYFSTLDLASGFHQIEMKSEDTAKTAFTVEGGHYEFVRMPFGLKNAPATFQRVMDNILGDLVGPICLVYLDDIIIFSPSLQEHITHLDQIFTKLTRANFKVQLSKSHFLHKEIEFLGHIITEQGIKPNPNKISAIQNFPCPKNRKAIKSFLGLLGYYRKFIKDFARLTKPMTRQLKGKKPVEINDEFLEAFEFSKTLLSNDPILQYPDLTKNFILTTDASNFALGAVLSQGTLQNDKPVCFASRTLSDTEVNYSTIEKEMLAIIWAVQYFRPYLFGRKFTIVTDHKPLIWLMNFKEPNSKIIRWRLQLLEYEFEIVHKKGSQNVIADALSRADASLNHNETAPEPVPNFPKSDKPINDFNVQLVLRTSPDDKHFTVTPFKHKIRREYHKPLFGFDDCANILKQTLKPNKTCAVFADETILKMLEQVYAVYFSNNPAFKLISCSSFLTEITNTQEQDKIISDYHTNNNHRGIDETFLHLKREYFFPYMKNKISQLINQCETCLRLKYDRHPQKISFLIPPTPGKPLDIIHMDIYCINNTYNLTLIDKFSKFAAAYPIQNRNSLNVVKSLKHFISLFGIPVQLVYDQGAEFSGNLFKAFCTQLKILLHETSFQQSSSNSPVERLHSSLTEIYRIILDTRKEQKLPIEHDELLTETLITYNNAIHSATKLTPYELFTGKTHSFNKNIEFSNEHDYLDKLHTFQEKLYPTVKEKLETIVKTRTEKLNESRTDPTTTEPNDIVLRKENRRNKVTPRFSLHQVANDHGTTLTTIKRQKLHKSKIRKLILKRKK